MCKHNNLRGKLLIVDALLLLALLSLCRCLSGVRRNRTVRDDGTEAGKAEERAARRGENSK
jgi:hypothetical protein